MNEEQHQQPPMSFKEKLDRAKTIMILPSLSVIVFLRYRIGYRILDSGWYLGVALVVFLIGAGTYDARSPFPAAMQWYSGAIVVLGATHRVIAWFQLRKGTQPHSYSTGISRLGFSFLPKWLRSPGLANAIYDPLVTAIVGFIVHQNISPAFGDWLFVAAVSTLFLEIFISVKSADRDMDIADGLIVAGVQAQTVKQWDGGGIESTNDGHGAISTGLGRDLTQQLKMQRRKNA